MNLSSLIKASNVFTDETTSDDFGLKYANEAIATLNTRFNLNLPFYQNVGEDYTALSESWQYRIVMNWISYGIKMNDSSLQEAMEYKQKFYDALNDFGELFLRTDEEGNYTELDGQYVKDKTGGVYKLDTTGAIDIGWFGRVR